MFCGRPENEVPFMLSGLDGSYICSDCVKMAADYLKEIEVKKTEEESSARIEKPRNLRKSKRFWTSMSSVRTGRRNCFR